MPLPPHRRQIDRSEADHDAAEPDDDRRRAPRHRVHGPADYRILHWYLRHGRILDLCLDGCLLEPRPAVSQLGDLAPHPAEYNYQPGDTLELRFEVRRLAFRAQGIVRRVCSNGQLGVEITGLSPRTRRLLQQLIAELEALHPDRNQPPPRCTS